MEEILEIKKDSYGTNKYALVRYADDFVVLSENHQNCQEAKY